MKKIKKTKKMSFHSQKGMTLVEVILSIAVLGIIASSFIIIYTTSLFWAVKSGDRTSNVYNAAGIVENSLAGSSIANTSSETISIDGATVSKAQYTENPVTLTVKFKGSAINKCDIDRTKVQVMKEQASVKNSKIQTQIEVYKKP